MHPKDLRIEDYTYELPDERIARYPLEERDASKLLIYKDGVIGEDTYRNIADHIPAGTLMVYNQTKVVHARLLFKKESGGVIEVFCLAPHSSYADVQTAMTQRGSVQWECLVGGASKWKYGMVLQLRHAAPQFTLSAKITVRTAGAYIIALEWDNDELTFAEILHHAGKVPLPPYLHREAEAGDETRYQTLYAREEGSVAAPTAGLHFTERVMQSLTKKGIEQAFVTLHVGAGTFKPVKAERMESHEMHAEWIDVTADFIGRLIRQIESRAHIVAVGTTSLRTLESLYWIGNALAGGTVPDLAGNAVTQWTPYDTPRQLGAMQALSALLHYMQEKNMQRLVTRTQVLIAPGYKFRIITGLVTNFHQPQSTLLLLVGVVTNNNWRYIYNHALSNDYRFLSYGDGSLLWLQEENKAINGG